MSGKLVDNNTEFGVTIEIKQLDQSKQFSQLIKAESVAEVKRRIISEKPEINPFLLDEKHFNAEFAKDQNYAYKVLEQLQQLRSDYETYRAVLNRKQFDDELMIQANARIIQITDMILYINDALYPPAPKVPAFCFNDENINNGSLWSIQFQLNTLDQVYDKYQRHIQSLVRDDDPDVSAAYQRQDEIGKRAHVIHEILAEKITQLFDTFLGETYLNVSQTHSLWCIQQLSLCMKVPEQEAETYLDQYACCTNAGNERGAKEVIEEVMQKIHRLKS